jgi:hypothetical protein
MAPSSNHSGKAPTAIWCYGEGSLRLPYQPFVEAFGTYVQDSDTETLIGELDWRAGDLARMVPILREQLHVTPRPPGDPEEDRRRLLQVATDLLRNVAANLPLLLVLEDLQDADRGRWTCCCTLRATCTVHESWLSGRIATWRSIEPTRCRRC